MSQPISLYYNQDYDSGVAHVPLRATLFEQDPTVYQSSLAQLAAGLLATASDRRGSLGKGIFLAPALSEQLECQDVTLYNYTKCEHPLVTVKGMSPKYAENDFAFSISHKAFQGQSPFELIVITFRGTESITESLFADFFGTLWDQQLVKWHGFLAYRSFAKFAEQVVTALNQYEKDHFNDGANLPKVYLLTGHSLGGAAAQLVSAALTERGERRVFTYTFGALNALTGDATHKYLNIWNVMNYYDTYGPKGAGAFGFRPANGRKTVKHKFGNVRIFKRDFRQEFHTFLWSKNHVMASYYQAVRDNIAFESDS